MSLPQLLIALVAFGAVASIAISHITDTRRRAYTELTKAELVKLAAAQQRHLAATGRYAATPDSAGYAPPPRVKVVIRGSGLATGAGWNATATHASLPGVACVIAAGADTAVRGVPVRPGTAVCRATD